MFKSLKYALLVISIISLGASPAISQEIDLASDKIPDSLLKGADVVIRYEKQILEVTDLDRASYKVHKIVTVLNERGKSYLVYQHWGDKFHKLVNFDLKVYDGNGRSIVKYKQKDL